MLIADNLAETLVKIAHEGGDLWEPFLQYWHFCVENPPIHEVVPLAEMLINPTTGQRGQ